MADTPAPLKIRGITCPNCVGSRLDVYKTRRPCNGKVVRYRKCSACGYRCSTEERKLRVLEVPKT